MIPLRYWTYLLDYYDIFGAQKKRTKECSFNPFWHDHSVQTTNEMSQILYCYYLLYFIYFEGGCLFPIPCLLCCLWHVCALHSLHPVAGVKGFARMTFDLVSIVLSTFIMFRKLIQHLLFETYPTHVLYEDCWTP